MIWRSRLNTAIILVLGLFLLSYIPPASAVNEEELEAQIEEKNRELQQLDSQIQETQTQIGRLQGEATNLGNAITAINAQINQVNYGIRSSEVNIQKLALELESLGFKLEDVDREIELKEIALAEVLREVQLTDGEGLLEVLLRNDTLADSVFEIQSLTDVRDSLNTNVAELAMLRVALEDNINQTNTKKFQIERENVTLKSRKTILADQQAEKDELLAETKNEESLYQQKLDALEKIKAEVADEINKIEAELRGQVDVTSLPQAKKGVLEVPTIGVLTQGYGRTAFALYTYKSQWHNGIDIGAPNGTPIVASESGEVVFATNQDAVLTNGIAYCRGGAYGKVVVIKHDNGLATLYAHMSLYLVDVGDRVERGELIGYIGRTGWATGPHIHYAVFDGSTYTLRQSRVCGPMPVGGDLNPLNYLAL